MSDVAFLLEDPQERPDGGVSGRRWHPLADLGGVGIDGQGAIDVLECLLLLAAILVDRAQVDMRRDKVGSVMRRQFILLDRFVDASQLGQCSAQVEIGFAVVPL